MPSSTSVVVAIGTIFLVPVVWLYYKAYIAHSPFDNVPGPPKVSVPLGHMEAITNRHGWNFLHHLISSYGPVVRIDGLLSYKQLYVFDPKALQHIVTKDQHIYEESATFLLINNILFGQGLLATVGDHHRHQRKLLNPVFTSAEHLRRLTPIFYEVTNRLRNTFKSHLKDGPQKIDMMQWFARVAFELLGQGGFGLSFDPLDSFESNSLADDIILLPSLIAPLMVLRPFLPLLKFGTPQIRRQLSQFFLVGPLRRLRNISYRLEDMAKEVLIQGRAAIAQEDIASEERKDIMTTLLRENMKANSEDRMSEEELIGHIATSTFGALDTTASALARVLYVLAEHQDVQSKLREEIREARNGGDIGYDDLVSLPYLDAVCREVLRLYPPVLQIAREANQDVILPFSEPIRGVDGTLMREILVPKDETVIISILGCNLNPEIWGDDAKEFKPERWLTPLPTSVTDARIPGVCSNLMTFLGGGRSCIGFKFSQLEMKVVLAVIVEAFNFDLPPEKIVWNNGGIHYPTVGPKSNKHEMPMMVSLAR